MFNRMKWLQFFADGGASGGDGSGDGADAGVTSADAGQSTGVQAADAGRRLEDLGVPKDKAEKYGKRMAKKLQAAAAAQATESAASEKPEDAKGQKQQQAAGNGMPSWDEYMQIPENKQRLESLMAARGRNATADRNAAQEQMAKLAPALELLAARYGKQAKDGQYDIDAIIEAVTGDDLFFEDKALETGESVDKVKSDWHKEREEAQRQQDARRQMLQNRFMEMQRQVPIVQQEYPSFDLSTEMQNPDFVHFVNARELGGMGWDLRKAFRAVHQEEIEQQQAEAIAKRVKSDTARVVQSNQSRPRENGSNAAPSVPANDYDSMRAMFRKMTPEERLRYIKAAHPPR